MTNLMEELKIKDILAKKSQTIAVELLKDLEKQIEKEPNGRKLNTAFAYVINELAGLYVILEHIIQQMQDIEDTT